MADEHATDFSVDAVRQSAAAAPPPRYKRSNQRRTIVIVAIVAVVLIVGGFFLWRYLGSYESTDDAQVDAHLYPVSARVSGHVIQVNVGDNEYVQQGKVLVEIDPKDYQVALEAAKANLASAEATAQSEDHRPDHHDEYRQPIEICHLRGRKCRCRDRHCREPGGRGPRSIGGRPGQRCESAGRRPPLQGPGR